ncbi:MAG: hypothetical protein M3451_12290 [Chloroflexota bacterium]|nr:hypothetical protein [Chloroflexota bacterium]
MITRSNQLTVPEVTAYSREEIEGGYVIRYLIRNPEEVEWRAVKVFRPDEPVASEQEVKRSWQTPNHSHR